MPSVHMGMVMLLLHGPLAPGPVRIGDPDLLEPLSLLVIHFLFEDSHSRIQGHPC